MSISVQEHIDETVALVRKALRPDLPAEERDHILSAVQNLGYQWQQANAHGRAESIAVGVSRQPEDTVIDLSDESVLEKMESVGCEEIIRVFGLPGYSALVMHLVDRATGGYDPKPNIRLVR